MQMSEQFCGICAKFCEICGNVKIAEHTDKTEIFGILLRRKIKIFH